MLSEFTQLRAEEVSRLERLESASVTLAALIGYAVPPPLQLGLGPLQCEEDDGAGNGDAARPRCGEDKVVL